MRNIYIVCLNNLPFLPYIHGLLRTGVEQDKELAARFRFRDPIFRVEPLPEILRRIENPAVLGLSCYVWNVRRQLKLAQLVKQNWPETLVIAGGPQIPDSSDEFLKEFSWLDILVHGEGEWTFREVLRESLLERPDWSKVRGISYRADSKVTKTKAVERTKRQIDLESPYTSGYLDSAIDLCRQHNLNFYAPWETNRGCPFSCTFCDWGSATMSKVRRFQDEALAGDIRFFAENKVPNIFICDANFGMLSRDIDIANELGQAHDRSGFPKQVRVNFAKNSNDRVFEISRTFSERDMLMGTTLSVQSGSEQVLQAVERQNISFGDLRALKQRYSRAGIHTYSELILGLPLETPQSFKEGIGALLEAGNHEDIRVYELNLLPNAPISKLSSRIMYDLRTIDKYIYQFPPLTPLDEVETAPLVFETSTMSRSDWISCSIFSQIIQCLHNGCYTRFVSVFARRQYGVDYVQFYSRIISDFSKRPDTLIGGMLAEMSDLYNRYVEDERIPQMHIISSQTELASKIARYGRRRGWSVSDWCWLQLSERIDDFYGELAEWLPTINVPLDELTKELLAYQKAIMLQPDYSPSIGKWAAFKYDFVTYFQSEAEPVRQQLTIHWRDTHMGVNHQYPLRTNDLVAFAKAAVGESYPYVRIRHYIHQNDTAEFIKSSQQLGEKRHVSISYPSH